MFTGYRDEAMPSLGAVVLWQGEGGFQGEPHAVLVGEQTSFHRSLWKRDFLSYN